jgi:hypothetical protein
LLVLAAIALACYFCFPRIQVRNLKAFETNPGQGLQIGGSAQDQANRLLTASASNPFAVSFAITVTVTVQSNSYITYRFDSIALDSLSVVDPATASTPVANNGLSASGQVESPTLPKMSTTNFAMVHLLISR